MNTPGQLVRDAASPLTLLVERDRKSGNLLGFVVELPRCYAHAGDLDSLRGKIQAAIKDQVGQDRGLDVCWI